MKIKITLFLTFNFITFNCLLPTAAFSQGVAINTIGAVADASAMLDVNSANKGFLIPRVALTATNNASPVTNPATSLLVYNTTTAGSFPNNVIQGYYYWSGSLWIMLFDGSQGAWTLTGNGNTNPTNHFIGTTNAVDLVIKTNNTEKIRILSGGNVGINTTNPSFKLDIFTPDPTSTGNTNGVRIRAGAQGDAVLHVDCGVNVGDGGGIRYWQNGTYMADVMLLGNKLNIVNVAGPVVIQDPAYNNNVGIGTATPSQRLEVCGNIKCVGTVYSNTAFTVQGFSCSSDLRYKKNIQTLNNALNRVLTLRGVNYEWKKKEFQEKQFPEGNQIGFIAQEIEKIYPEVVGTDESGYKTVDYSRLTPVLVEAIKEQQGMIDSLILVIGNMQTVVGNLQTEIDKQQTTNNTRIKKLEEIIGVKPVVSETERAEK